MEQEIKYIFRNYKIHYFNKEKTEFRELDEIPNQDNMNQVDPSNQNNDPIENIPDNMNQEDPPNQNNNLIENNELIIKKKKNTLIRNNLIFRKYK